MRKLSSVIALVAAITLMSAPSMAQQKTSSDGAVVLATLGGAVVGGALVYYYFPLSQLTTTTLGAVVGGTIGSWWYGASDGSDSYQAPLPRRSDVDGSVKPFRLIAYSEGTRPSLRSAN
ncbi:MAG: hypothetical protein EXQ95_09340 [Alphaproteobacteria bacterium]|nr:hypothetical protein [Alphaproteobacteria bacterium]